MSFYCGLITSTFGTVPFAFGLMHKLNTIEMEPFDRTSIVVAAYHFSVRHLVAQAIGRLIGVDVMKVQWRTIARFVGAAFLLLDFPLFLLPWRLSLFILLLRRKKFKLKKIIIKK